MKKHVSQQEWGPEEQHAAEHTCEHSHSVNSDFNWSQRTLQCITGESYIAFWQNVSVKSDGVLSAPFGVGILWGVAMGNDGK
jgi:hypothetical protein